MFKSFVKLAVLRELATGERSGYDLIQACSRSKRVSAGYMYPLLQDLWTSRYILQRTLDRKKLYSLTPKGRRLLSQLEAQQSSSMQQMSQILSPLFEEPELEKLIAFRKDVTAHKPQLAHDLDLYMELHRAMFAVYDQQNIASNRKMRAQLSDLIKKLRSIR